MSEDIGTYVAAFGAALVTALVVIASLVRQVRDKRGSGNDRVVAGGQH